MHDVRSLCLRTAGAVSLAAALAVSVPMSMAAGCAPVPTRLATVTRAQAAPEDPSLGWQERFQAPQLDWVDPFGHDPSQILRVYSLETGRGGAFLHARHDATVAAPPPAIDLGQPFQKDPVPLERVTALRWRWRVLQHPAVTDDPWLDVAASVYVVIKVPSLLWGGRGFKFGWLAEPGAKGTYQHGLLQIELRHDPAGPAWRSESVDLCALYRKEYGPCEGQFVRYVGVVTDADNTRSVASADYADFELVTNGVGAERGRFASDASGSPAPAPGETVPR